MFTHLKATVAIAVVTLSAALLLGSTHSVDRAVGSSMTGTQLVATAANTSLTPTLDLGLAASRATAIPVDQITYDATVTNTGAKLAVSGAISISNYDAPTKVVSAVSDYVEYFSVDQKRWIPLAGSAEQRSGYTPKFLPPTSSGLRFCLPGGTQLLGATVSGGSTAVFNYQARITLTPAQVRFLLDPAQVRNIRNVVHVEAPAAGSQKTVGGDTAKLMFTHQFATQSATSRHVRVSITRPDDSVATFDENADSRLTALPVGESVALSTSYTVPLVDAKGGEETDSGYETRLAQIDGQTLAAGAQATAYADGAAALAAGSAADEDGDVVVGSSRAIGAPPASTHGVEHVPVMTVEKDGPTSADPGSTVTYDIAVSNTGGANGSPALTDAVGGGAPEDVFGLPLSLAAGEADTAHVDVDIASDQVAGDLADTASLRWTDENGNAYGPVSSSFTTTVTTPPDAQDTDGSTGDGDDLVAGDSLTNPIVRDVTGTKVLGGGCQYATKLVPPPGYRSVEARELSDDPGACTAKIEVGIPPASAIRSDIQDAIALGIEPDAIPAVTAARFRSRRARTAGVCASASCRSIDEMKSWMEDPLFIDVNKVWTVADWRWNGDVVLSGRGLHKAKPTSPITDWYLSSQRLRTVQTDEKVSARSYVQFKNKDFVGCLGHWTYINYSPNKALGFPNGGGDGRMRWSRTGALCRIALHANSRFTMLR